MPLLDGHEFCKQTRQIMHGSGKLQPYIVACTGNTEDSQVEEAFKSEFDELVGKPVDVELMEGILREVVDMY